MLKRSCLVVVFLLCLFPLPAFAEASPEQSVASKIEFRFSLPKDISKTDFAEAATAQYKVDAAASAPYQMKGVPFLYNDTTYVPVRDMAEAFGLYVGYNPQDRFVSLGLADRVLYIAPNMTNVGGGYYYEISKGVGIVTWQGKKVSGINESMSYIGVDDRSYVPLRVILESFGFNVSYDDATKEIKITGNRGDQNVSFPFSPDQQKVIAAMAGYEAARKVSYEGNIPKIDSGWYTVDLIKSVKEDRVVSNYTVTSTPGWKLYETTNEMAPLSINETAYPIAVMRKENIDRVLPSGEKEWVKMSSGFNPLCWIGEFFLSGSNKYKEMAVIKVNETAGTEVYRVTKLDGQIVKFEIEIDKNSGKLVRYTEMMEGRGKSLALAY